MQYHLHGHRSGDPRLAPAVDAGPTDEVDVLIVGSGPAGLTVATQLAAFGDLNVRVVEQKPGPLKVGQADGIAVRTVEMFQAFGFADRVVAEAYWVNETVFWKPDPEHPERVVRTGRIQDTEDGLSEFPHVILSQARVHDFYLDTMRNSPRRLEPSYSRQLVGLDTSDNDFVTATLACLDAESDAEEPVTETVRARYIVGCDGARSAVRQLVGLEMAGDSANAAWGVMDVLAVTDFPDIRLKAAVQSANEGSLLVIPREGGYMARLYIELDKLNPDERVSSRNLTSDDLVAAANRILAPYSIDVREIAWWSVYEIGQRLTNRFDDATGDRPARVIIAGDACHTHSPKAGQGMNVGMADGFNLGWKLGAVARGQARPELLATYSAERQAIADELIEFDRMFAKRFAAKPTPDEEAAFQDAFERAGRYTAGVETTYAPSLICAEPTYQHLATGFPLGMRLHSAPVIRLADAKPVHLGHVITADGRWRILLFADDPSVDEPDGGALADEPMSELDVLCARLLEDPSSPLRRYTPDGTDIDSVLDVRAVFQQPHQEVDVGALPQLLHPAKGALGLRDYEKVFCPLVFTPDDIFELRGIDRGGAMVIVRPDQYVANILPLTAWDELTAFFDGFMIDTSCQTG